DYFGKLGGLPVRVAVVMAGPRDDASGIIKLTNANWPAFNPLEVGERYAGSQFITANDMIGTAAGVLAETSLDLKTLKSGHSRPTGNKLIMTLSTGVGAAAAVWDGYSQRYVFMATEAGHIGIQPKSADESKYLEFLQSQHSHASAERALSGKHGIENLVRHSLEQRPAPELSQAVERALENSRPLGAVLLEFALEDKASAGQGARRILGNFGAMIGSVMRDLTVALKAAGGVYLTGSVGLGLGEYLAEQTDFKQRFVQAGSVHDEWLEKIPIQRVTNPNVAVLGALALALEH
ncbi:MAG: glucokinase, partial [Candidatus Saccharimonadales bacterium]